MANATASAPRIDLKQSLVDTVLAGLVALIVFGPIVGIVLDGYSFNLQPVRLAWMVGAVMAGRLVLSLFLQTAAGGRVLERFESSDSGISVLPPGYKTRLRWIVPLLVVAAVALPFFANKYLLTVVILGLIYVLLGLGLNIVVGLAGLLDLGYVAFYAIGAYGLALGYQYLGLGFWTVLPLAAITAAMAGALLGFPVLRMHGDYLAIVTLGFGEIVRIFMNNLDAPINITNGPQGINRVDTFSVAGFSFGRSEQILGFRITGPEKYYYLLLLLTILIVIVCARLQNSRIGRAWEAVREDEIAAKAMGINTRNIKLLAFSMGATFGGLAGAMFASMQGFVSPESFSLTESISVLCMVVLGGMGNIPGVILGAILLAALPEFLRATVEPLQRLVFGEVVLDPEGIRMLLFGLAMVCVMLFRPAGLWPSAVRKRELAGAAGGQA